MTEHDADTSICYFYHPVVLGTAPITEYKRVVKKWIGIETRVKTQVREKMDQNRNQGEDPSLNLLMPKFGDAVALIALRGFTTINWARCEDMCDSEDLHLFISFQEVVFKAMIKFVLYIYDMEDFEHIVAIDEINEECEEFWSKLCTDFRVFSKTGENPWTVYSAGEGVSSFSRMREQDIANNLRWFQIHYSDDNHSLEKCKPRYIGSFAFERQEGSPHFPLSRYRDIARQAMKQYAPLNEEDRMHLLMELKECKCHCILDACYVEFWREINIQELEKLFPSKMDLFYRTHHATLEGLAYAIHHAFFRLTFIKAAALRECHKLVVYPLASRVFGEWSSEVGEVVKRAELQRRIQRRRFVGVDHLYSCLLQTRISESAKEYFKNMESIVVEEEDMGHLCYHIYRTAYDVARFLGHQTIGLEHLYLAIVYGRHRDGKIDLEVLRAQAVKDFLESVRNGAGNYNGGDEDETSLRTLDPLFRFLPDGVGWDMGDSVLKVVKEFRGATESGFSPLETRAKIAISG